MSGAVTLATILTSLFETVSKDQRVEFVNKLALLDFSTENDLQKFREEFLARLISSAREWNDSRILITSARALTMTATSPSVTAVPTTSPTGTGSW
jgi:hypothetical protein